MTHQKNPFEIRQQLFVTHFIQCVYVCISVRERERLNVCVFVKERERVFDCVRDRESVCVCICVCAFVCVHLYVCMCVLCERESKSRVRRHRSSIVESKLSPRFTPPLILLSLTHWLREGKGFSGWILFWLIRSFAHPVYIVWQSWSGLLKFSSFVKLR